MSDKEIRKALIDMKRAERQMQIKTVIESVLCWSGLLAIGFMLTVIGS